MRRVLAYLWVRAGLVARAFWGPDCDRLDGGGLRPARAGAVGCGGAPGCPGRWGGAAENPADARDRRTPGPPGTGSRPDSSVCRSSTGRAANYAGKNPNAVDPVLVQLIRNLMPDGGGSLRIGGVTTDWTWWPVHGVAQPGGVNYTLTTSRLKCLGALARAVGARLILGLNLEADSPAVATAEEQAMLQGDRAPKYRRRSSWATSLSCIRASPGTTRPTETVSSDGPPGGTSPVFTRRLRADRRRTRAGAARRPDDRRLCHGWI